MSIGGGWIKKKRRRGRYAMTAEDKRLKKLKELEINVGKNRHVCTQMSLKFHDVMNSIGLEKDSEGDWYVVTDQCYPGVRVIFCPYCAKKL